MEIILTTLNARYTHSSIALRYLLANLRELQSRAEILEYVINENIQSIAEKILANRPKIVGIGVYIWNIVDVIELVEVIKLVSPETIVILGGPEVSYGDNENLSLADYIVEGEGEESFYTLCRDILDSNPPKERVIKPKALDLKSIELPYSFYDDNDIKNRAIYVELSRGCPFKCEFCLSSLDKLVRYFDIEKLIAEFELLWQKGVRSFKFIDRTFNLDLKLANRLFDFFLSKEPPYFVHFEVIPDKFPKELRDRIASFPKASLQLEVGIQTLNLDIAQNINRKLNLEKIRENITFLEQTNVHIHLDLIVGLPDESIESFADNLNTLVEISSSEIQIGILKKLKGTTISRHDRDYGMIYSKKAPYDILQTSKISFEQMQEMKRFARFWDLTYNSGNFKVSVKYIWSDCSVFDGFLDFSRWIYKISESTWQFSLNRLSQYLFEYLTEIKGFEKNQIAQLITDDILKIEGRKLPSFLRAFDIEIKSEKKKLTAMNKRQLKHI